MFSVRATLLLQCAFCAEPFIDAAPVAVDISSAAAMSSTSTCINRVRKESQLAAPAKKQSVRRSVRRKLEQQAAAAAGSGLTSHATPAAAAAAGTANSSSSSSSTGVRFLSLGLSPLHQMDDSRFQHSSKVRSLFEASFKHGAAYYPFQPLAAAKAKYGAGLHGGR
jgi:hypothetical protein